MSAREDLACEFKWIQDGEIKVCTRLSEYRVKEYSEREVLQDEGGWSRETTERYLCADHFDQGYKYSDTMRGRKWSYVIIRRELTRPDPTVESILA